MSRASGRFDARRAGRPLTRPHPASGRISACSCGQQLSGTDIPCHGWARPRNPNRPVRR